VCVEGRVIVGMMGGVGEGGGGRGGGRGGGGVAAASELKQQRIRGCYMTGSSVIYVLNIIFL